VDRSPLPISELLMKIIFESEQNQKETEKEEERKISSIIQE
jgi:hypothetical protein